MDEEVKFAEFLHRSGLKITQARRQVLEEVFQCHDHFDADDLFLKLKGKQSRVSRATVYRTLGLLVSSKLVRKMNIGAGRSVYEHILGHQHHDHLICLKCGEIFEFHNTRVEELQKKVCEEFNFQMMSHTQQIYGVCKKCRKKSQ